MGLGVGAVEALAFHQGQRFQETTLALVEDFDAKLPCAQGLSPFARLGFSGVHRFRRALAAEHLLELLARRHEARAHERLRALLDLLGGRQVELRRGRCLRDEPDGPLETRTQLVDLGALLRDDHVRAAEREPGGEVEAPEVETRGETGHGARDVPIARLVPLVPNRTLFFRDRLGGFVGF